MNDSSSLPTCKICGATVPNGKELCWCCEHGPKLHVDSNSHKCEDSCEIKFDGQELVHHE